ncbi:MAG: DegT/DnrJ/EryC1/StrS aminotransferase [Candidatus Collierbacteria bacterium GW2011_GWB1_44_35]|uniref:DegT/DnrJ/EryC1/StrS aminotransferase n=4 Tax=Candidatus Collieribacteriota TaxID=1752725 RepID=A0A0G1JTB9_9BACT|nr:MAG: DegT/DnrJ/EryC1/StrS aminotransferase [Candidatus Collierbacteria bacterium GW2011_GWA1_44_12]KKT39269.1 MAG: DegT/DnrJ/EryC1/StrS aminotransferase [Candidatus Collierbacteria bacterium GW2011_GWF1_44_12]KKT47177.1 MAG: DegT/DnrJ/EryC1/StrS aminotransferase [Candidatus Collierbacteria bacterium GW2011_GWF2_44_15]KKT67875.1 MAG: DegT/DnrJ/EryC1/StrS aminotransferase [Candidatus Collierbacteria bacterium GW2011_GWB1_44_35]
MFQGEPSLGSIYGEEERVAVNKTLEASMDPSVGFYAAKETLELEKEFARVCNADHAVAFNGAGSALDLIFKALHLKAGDEVISCSLNFPGTHLSIIGEGGRLILCEPDPKTINIDPFDVAKKLTPRTRAVLVTHMNGLAADVDMLKQVIDTSTLFGPDKPKIICDAARSIGTTYKGQHLGSEAWATFFSLQSKKVISTLGEGGIVTTNDTHLAETLKNYRSFGRSFEWGSNFKMTKIQTAVGLVQLEKLPHLVSLRRNLADQRNQEFSTLGEINIQEDTPYSESSYYLYTLILPENEGGKKRDQLMDILKFKYGIGSVVGNPPTYKLNQLIRSETEGQSLPIAENLGERIICLSLHPSMTQEVNQYIIDSFTNAYRDIFS